MERWIVLVISQRFDETATHIDPLPLWFPTLDTAMVEFALPLACALDANGCPKREETLNNALLALSDTTEFLVMAHRVGHATLREYMSQAGVEDTDLALALAFVEPDYEYQERIEIATRGGFPLDWSKINGNLDME